MGTTHESSKHTDVKPYEGGCHCGAVRFAVDIDMAEGGTRCNCTV
jgi:hypothetical protein